MEMSHNFEQRPLTFFNIKKFVCQHCKLTVIGAEDKPSARGIAQDKECSPDKKTQAIWVV